MSETPNTVRQARVSDATRIGEIQARAMHEALVAALAAPLSEPLYQELDATAFAQTWSEAIAAPPSDDHRVLVATNGEVLTAFAAIVPTPTAAVPAELTSDSEAFFEIAAFEVSSRYYGEGHEARLLAAITDTLARVGNGKHGLLMWIFPTDEVKLRLLSNTGFAPAGQQRSLEADGKTLLQHLWWTTIG